MGNDKTAGGDDGREDERSFVSDAAGGMFVHLLPGRFEKLRTSPEYNIASVRAASSERDMPRNHTAISQAAIW